MQPLPIHFSDLTSFCFIFISSPKRRFSDYMKVAEEVQAAEPKLILKRSPKEVSKLEQVLSVILLAPVVCIGLHMYNF